MIDNQELRKEVYPDCPSVGQVIGFLSAARIIESAYCYPHGTNEFIEACRIVEATLHAETKQRQALEE